LGSLLADIEPSMEEYQTIRLLKAGRNCSSSCAQAGG
jgi:hypothetical protein